MKHTYPIRKDNEKLDLIQFTASDDDLTINFNKNEKGRPSIWIIQKNTQEARNVEVTVHKFFGGTFSETFYAHEFGENHLEQFVGHRERFPDDLFEALLDGNLQVSAEVR